MLTKKPGASVHPTGESDPLEPPTGRLSPAGVAGASPPALRPSWRVWEPQGGPEEGSGLADSKAGSSGRPEPQPGSNPRIRTLEDAAGRSELGR